MKPYADSNFFTRLYLVLSDSTFATELLAGSRLSEASPLPITWLHQAEIVNALQLHVFGGRQQGQARITMEQAATAQGRFREDISRSDFLRGIELAQRDLVRKLEDLSLRHTAKHGFRVYDVIHVASALILECDTFWSFDTKACKLAALEGLKLAKR